MTEPVDPRGGRSSTPAQRDFEEWLAGCGLVDLAYAEGVALSGPS
jgi:hypothetical protein